MWTAFVSCVIHHCFFLFFRMRINVQFVVVVCSLLPLTSPSLLEDSHRPYVEEGGWRTYQSDLLVKPVGALTSDWKEFCSGPL